MNARHFIRRAPGKGPGFHWGRFPSEDGQRVTYRLFRRDHRNAMHQFQQTFPVEWPRSAIAINLWHVRIRFRNEVDAVFFAAEGIAA